MLRRSCCSPRGRRWRWGGAAGRPSWTGSTSPGKKLFMLYMLPDAGAFGGCWYWKLVLLMITRVDTTSRLVVLKAPNHTIISILSFKRITRKTTVDDWRYSGNKGNGSHVKVTCYAKRAGRNKEDGAPNSSCQGDACTAPEMSMDALTGDWQGELTWFRLCLLLALSTHRWYAQYPLLRQPFDEDSWEWWWWRNPGLMIIVATFAE